MSACCSSDACQGPAPNPGYRRILWIALGLNAAMFFVEAVTSLVAGSVSLQADALDFLDDAANHAVALIVLGLAVRWRARAAAGKGIVMGTFAIAVAGNTLWHAFSGGVPRADLMSGIGLLALVVNLAVAVMLHRPGGPLRQPAAFREESTSKTHILVSHEVVRAISGLARAGAAVRVRELARPALLRRTRRTTRDRRRNCDAGSVAKLDADAGTSFPRSDCNRGCPSASAAASEGATRLHRHPAGGTHAPPQAGSVSQPGRRRIPRCCARRGRWPCRPRTCIWGKWPGQRTG